MRRSANESGTHYDVLGVQPDASPHAIDNQFRALAKIVHPDHGGDAVMFEVLMDSYEVLRDPVQRAEYDRSLRAAQAARQATAAAQRTATSHRPTASARPAASSRPTAADPPPIRYVGRFTQAEWDRAMDRSLLESIVATIAGGGRRSQISLRTGTWTSSRKGPLTWPLADPSGAGQFINAMVGLFLLMMIIYVPVLVMFAAATSR